MKAKISKSGNLSLQRNHSEYIEQLCPITRNSCGAQCPHFGEPEENAVTTTPNPMKSKIEIKICYDKILRLDHIIYES